MSRYKGNRTTKKGFSLSQSETYYDVNFSCKSVIRVFILRYGDKSLNIPVLLLKNCKRLWNLFFIFFDFNHGGSKLFHKTRIYAKVNNTPIQNKVISSALSGRRHLICGRVTFFCIILRNASIGQRTTKAFVSFFTLFIAYFYHIWWLKSRFVFWRGNPLTTNRLFKTSCLITNIVWFFYFFFII